jgi:hypothetical protein
MVTVVAYACSAAASVLHAQTVFTGNPDASSLAFVLLTICYGVIIVVLAVLTRGQANGPRVMWVVALALFAVSASHLGRSHTDRESWAVELVGHHAAIPLAFAILYQDYRFALADLFLKRALTLLALVAIALAGYSVVVALPAGPLTAALLLALWVATALIVPWLHRRVVRFVDASLLRRMDYGVLVAEISTIAAAADSVDGVMEAACRALQPALNAKRVWWTERSKANDTVDAGETATAVVPTTEHPTPAIHVGELTGGRRLLSDDVALLDSVAAIAARRIDQIRLTAERYKVQLREEEMLKLTAEAELKALRAQINPHFLFNALTTVGYLVEAAPARAVTTLFQLTALLRGVLRSDGEFTTLGREIDLVEHYLMIERERFEERLSIRIDVPANLRDCRIPTLVLQPLVENAIKHGISRSRAGGLVEVLAARLTHDTLKLMVRNTGAPLTSVPNWELQEHVGVDNVRRRLAGHFGAAATFELIAAADESTVAELTMPYETGAMTHDRVEIGSAARP